MRIKLFTNLVIATPVVVTLFVTDHLLDPFNIGKLALMVTLSGLLILSLPNQLIGKIPRSNSILILVTLLAFFLSQVFSILVNKQNINQALLGVWGRNNGLLFYLALSIILISTFVFVSNFGDAKLIYAISILGLFQSFYGLMQWQKAEIFRFANGSNPVFLTFGNEDFSSLFLTMSIISTLSLVVYNKHNFKRFLLLTSATFQFFILIKMNTTQSKICLVWSLFVYLLFKLDKYRKKQLIFRIGIFAILILGVTTIEGALIGKGPFSFINNNLGSLNSRYLHWVAGLKMFVFKPLSGVGLDAYGDFQPFFRIVDKNGIPDTYSNNAHNVFIQYLATGGIFMGISFLVLFIILSKSLLKIIKNTNLSNNTKITYTSFYSVILVNIFIGIENAALAVWLWAFMGSIIAISNIKFSSTYNLKSKKTKATGARAGLTLATTFVGILLVVFSILPWRNALIEYQLKSLFEKPYLVGSTNELFSKIDQTASQTQVPEVRLYAISYLDQANQNDFAYKLTKDSNINFPRNLKVLEALFRYYVKTNNFTEAVKIKKSQITLDPLNSKYKQDLAEIPMSTKM